MAGTTSSQIVLKAFYRPQRSCGKLMFLHLPVILFTRGGVSDWGVSVQGGLCPGGQGSLSGGVFVQRGLSRLGKSLPGVAGGGLCPRGLSVQGGLCPGRSLSGRPTPVR